MTLESPGRSLSDFTVELDVYSGPYEWLLALILKDELEISEVPLRELVALYLRSRNPDSPNTLERDTDFAGSAAALVLLKSRTLFPALDTDPEGEDEVPLPPEELAERLSEYLKIRRGADFLDRKSTRLNSSHANISYAVFCLKKKHRNVIVTAAVYLGFCSGLYTFPLTSGNREAVNRNPSFSRLSKAVVFIKNSPPLCRGIHA